LVSNKIKNMKQLLPLFLFLLPCLALAQYPTNGNQKITLGEQTTADGLIFRGVLADTGIITPSRDTSAYIILDTVNHRFYNYNRATNVWSMAGVGSISSGLTGTLPVANGGTNTSTAFTTGSVVFAGSGGTYTQDNSNLFWDNSNKRLGIGVSNPANNLHIRNNDNTAVRLLFQNTLKGTSAQASIQLESNAGIGSINVYSDTFGVAGLPSTLLISSGNLVNGIIINTSLSTAPIIFRINSTERMRLSTSGNLGIGQTTPTAVLHLKAGTATASTAPLKFTSGTNLTSPLGGEMEFNGTNLFFSPSTTRHTVNHGLTGSATLNFPSTNAQSSADDTIAVTGAAVGDVVSLGVPNAAVNANTSYSAWVSAANTVTVRFNNYSSGTVDPASALFKVFVTK
jgi:hypothetical protein